MMDVFVTTSIEDVLDYTYDDVAGYPAVVCDIETTSLSVRKGRILCIGFGRADRDDVLVWWPKNLGDIWEVVLPKAIFHNASFDQRWLRHYEASVHTIWDTMIMAHLLDENHPSGLKSLGSRLLGYEDWSEDVANIEDLPKDRVTEYLAKDVQVTRELFRLQRETIKKGLKPGEKPEQVMRQIMLPASDPLTQMESNGLPVSVSAVRRRRQQVEERIQEIERELDASIPAQDMWPEWLRRSKPKWGATNWTKWWLFEYQGAPKVSVGKPTKVWPEGSPSLSQETLSRINHPGAKLLQERSKLYKNLTAFLLPLEERTVNGRISTSFRITGTVTGRLSSASPGEDDPGINSQQIPRDKATRNLFGEKGRAWIEADYSQLELRVAAVLSGEQTMLKLFNDGVDIHTYMAERLVQGGEVTKEARTLAKGVNFGFLYGMHASHFANYVQESYGLVITQKEAEAFREEYFATFSGLPPWYRKQRATALEHGGVPNAFGRFRHLPRVYSDDYWVQENAFRQAINSPVQSTGSDFMLISLARLAWDESLREMGAQLVTTVHDSVCLTVPYKYAKKAAWLVKKILEKADDRLDKKFYLKADVSVSKVWGGEALYEC